MQRLANLAAHVDRLGTASGDQGGQMTPFAIVTITGCSFLGMVYRFQRERGESFPLPSRL